MLYDDYNCPLSPLIPELHVVQNLKIQLKIKDLPHCFDKISQAVHVHDSTETKEEGRMRTVNYVSSLVRDSIVLLVPT